MTDEIDLLKLENDNLRRDLKNTEEALLDAHVTMACAIKAMPQGSLILQVTDVEEFRRNRKDYEFVTVWCELSDAFKVSLRRRRIDMIDERKSKLQGKTIEEQWKILWMWSQQKCINFKEFKSLIDYIVSDSNELMECIK